MEKLRTLRKHNETQGGRENKEHGVLDEDTILEVAPSDQVLTETL